MVNVIEFKQASKEGSKEARKEARKEGWKQGRKEARKQGTSPVDSSVRDNTAVQSDLLSRCPRPWSRTEDDQLDPTFEERRELQVQPSDLSLDYKSLKQNNKCSLSEFSAVFTSQI